MKRCIRTPNWTRNPSLLLHRRHLLFERIDFGLGAAWLSRHAWRSLLVSGQQGIRGCAHHRHVGFMNGGERPAAQIGRVSWREIV